MMTGRISLTKAYHKTMLSRRKSPKHVRLLFFFIVRPITEIGQVEREPHLTIDKHLSRPRNYI